MIHISNHSLVLSISPLALASALVFAQPAFAQAAGAADEDVGDTIVVTARKREEDILDVPVTVTAMTAEDLDVRGVTSMQNLAASTPGININDSSSGHADRGFQQVVLRGFTPVTTLATTTSLFIDGVAVSSPSAFTAISSPARIEILKGPQSAYFGRNTFAGAINVVNKEPDAGWSGSLMASGGTRQNYRGRAVLEAANDPESLGFRATVDYFTKNGSWRNAAPGGGTLGDQSTLSGTLLVVLKPTDRIKIKGFAMASRDRDGAPANARLVTQDVKAANGTVILRNQSNCTFPGSISGIQATSVAPATPNRGICGTVPRLINPISANVNNDSVLRTFLYSFPENRMVAPEKGVQEFGLLRQYRHYHVTAEFELSDAITATVLAGYNKEYWNTMIDLDGFDGSLLTVGNPGVQAAAPRGYYDFPFLVERRTSDKSAEARFDYDFGALRGVAGVSYLDAKLQTGSRGSVVMPLTGTPIFGSAGPPAGLNRNKTTGFFFGATYDITDAFSISAEGRYQIDKLIVFARPGVNTVVNSSALIPAGTYAPGSVLAQAKFKTFTPRVIVNYDINPDMMVYASWAKGVNPSQFNANILSLTDAVQQSAVAAGARIAVEPEKITNYELGLKGTAANGAVRYALSGYFAQWRKQINSITILAPNPANPGTPFLVNAFQNSGTVDLKGVELETSWKANDLITLEFAGAVNDTNIKNFFSVALSQLTGIFDYSGKEMPYTSKYSFNIGATVGREIDAWDGKWFVRGDWSYKSGTFSGQANTAKSRARNVVNMRAGISKGPMSLEAFVTNVFNDTNYTSLIDQTLFDPSLPNGVRANAALFVNLPDKRTAGVQVKFEF
jgi:iron complex outermembrane recepter protein